MMHFRLQTSFELCALCILSLVEPDSHLLFVWESGSARLVHPIALFSVLTHLPVLFPSSHMIIHLVSTPSSPHQSTWPAGGHGGGSREVIRMQKQNLKLLEENNLLKYKVELLLDMLAASNADCLVLQRELEAVKKVHSQTPRKR